MIPLSAAPPSSSERSLSRSFSHSHCVVCRRRRRQTRDRRGQVARISVQIHATARHCNTGGRSAIFHQPWPPNCQVWSFLSSSVGGSTFTSSLIKSHGGDKTQGPPFRPHITLHQTPSLSHLTLTTTAAAVPPIFCLIFMSAAVNALMIRELSHAIQSDGGGGPRREGGVTVTFALRRRRLRREMLGDSHIHVVT